MNKISQFLSTIAPLLGTALGGPLGGYAGTLVAKALGAKSNSQPDLEAAMATATPEQIIALQQANNELREKMQELNISEEQLAYTDTQSARQMQVQTKDPTAARLAWLLVGGFVLIAIIECITMTIWPEKWAAIPAAALTLLGTLFGYFAGEAKQVVAFYFGSSSDSQAKTQTLSEIAKS